MRWHKVTFFIFIGRGESFEFAVTLDDSFMAVLEGLIAMEEMNSVEDYSLLECIAPSER